MDKKQFLESKAEELLESEKHFLVEVIWSKSSEDKFAIIIDGDEGVTIDDCSKLSRKLGNELEENNEFQKKFILDVTSPGVGKPLKLKRQYYNNIGRPVKVKTEQNTIKGKLLRVSENEIVLLEKKGKKKEELEITIPLNEIKSTIVEVSFK